MGSTTRGLGYDLAKAEAIKSADRGQLVEFRACAAHHRMDRH